MTNRLAVYSTRLYRLKDELRHMSGLRPRLALFPLASDRAVAGWGHKPTAARAREIARRKELPYIAFEDGFLRSLKPGEAQAPSSLVMDRSGIYYDARRPSDLETMLQGLDASDAERSEARDLLELIRRHRLSKYNHGLEDLGASPSLREAPRRGGGPDPWRCRDRRRAGR